MGGVEVNDGGRRPRHPAPQSLFGALLVKIVDARIEGPPYAPSAETCGRGFRGTVGRSATTRMAGETPTLRLSLIDPDEEAGFSGGVVGALGRAGVFGAEEDDGLVGGEAERAVYGRFLVGEQVVAAG